MLPSHVKIGPYSYQVIEQDKAWYNKHDVYGMCCRDTKQIEVYVSRDIIEVVDTFLHECLHALWNVVGLPANPDEEQAVTQISTGVLMLIVDNPLLVDLFYQASIQTPSGEE